MDFLSTPLEIGDFHGRLIMIRHLKDIIEMLDNLVELIIFTPRGSFNADPDFGFEYWNYEYSNVHFREFNNGMGTTGSDVSKQVCEDSVKFSLASYAPMLTQVNVAMELNALTNAEQHRRRTMSKYEVIVLVDGNLDYGLSTEQHYSKVVRFLMEPMAKKMII